MQVLKFGGTTLKSSESFEQVAEVIKNKQPLIVVLSAMEGTTNALEDIARYLYKKDTDKALQKITELEQNYINGSNKIFKSGQVKKQAGQVIQNFFEHIRLFAYNVFTLFEEKDVLAQGELLSSAIMHLYLEEAGIKTVLIPALNFMRIDKQGEPDLQYIREKLLAELKQTGEGKIVITQGYICRNEYGAIDNLKRGGSDYTAALIGTAINCNEIQLWADFSKYDIYQNDISNITEISFDEAAELAYFGAKIVHPAFIAPAKAANIPVRIKNIADPYNNGILINNNHSEPRVKSIAVKDNITVIKIKSGRMLDAYGFLRKVFEVFETYQTPIDVIATSEIGVSVSIDNTKYIDPIIFDLQQFGIVDIDKSMVLIGIIGNLSNVAHNIASDIFCALKNIPLRMISFGGSNYNISVVINKQFKDNALQLLKSKLLAQ